MKKITSVICVSILTLLMASVAVAQTNPSAYFLLDYDLEASDYQGVKEILDIGGRQLVGFALYARQWENAKGFTVEFTWDSAYAEFRTNTSSTSIVDDEYDINGLEGMIPDNETNILGEELITSGLESSEGYYTNSYAMSGGDAVNGDGLVYFAVFRTVEDLDTETAFSIKAEVTVADASGNTRYLGERTFFVNGTVDVKDATWGEFKKQYSDF